MPNWLTLKLGLYGLAGLALLWLAIIVLGWRHDSQALHKVEIARDTAIHDRDQARDAKSALETKVIGQLGHIEGAVLALQQRYAVAETQRIGDRAAITGAIDTFKEVTAHVQGTPLPGSDDDVLVRARLRDLLRNPDTGQLGRGSGGSEGGAGAAMPAAAGEPHDVPGRRPAASDKPGAVVPGANQGGRSGAKRTAEGRRRRSDRLGATGAKGPAKAARVGQAVSEATVTVTFRCEDPYAAARCADALAKLVMNTFEASRANGSVEITHG